ncbi:protein kinase family protein [Pasteurella sp. PK-2025]|uniref:protein kinase family protein n=1 Tax=Pasteurella sp. PK-2025 TaxID=3413133 RepID=UPI003C770A99
MESSRLSFEDYVQHIVHQNKGKRIHHFEYHGQYFWIKQPEVLSLGWRLLKPYPEQAFQNEMKTLKSFAQLAAPVPKLLISRPDFFVLEDAGPTLADWMENPSISLQKKQQILSEGVKALVALHHQGLAHGRPAIRDMAWNGEQIRFIDLENHMENQPTKQIQDVMIFMHSLCRSKVISDQEVKRVIAELAQQSAPNIWQQVIVQLRKYRFIYYLLLPFKPIAKTDLIAIYRLFENMSDQLKRKVE